jgi:hypothetical protein
MEEFPPKISFRQQQLIHYKTEFEEVYRSLNDSDKAALEGYYNENMDFIKSAIEGNTKTSINICLESVKASISYLKVFAKNSK